MNVIYVHTHTHTYIYIYIYIGRYTGIDFVGKQIGTGLYTKEGKNRKRKDMIGRGRKD
jgi:hypothetical protein